LTLSFPPSRRTAVYSIYTSPNHAPIPNHLPTLIVTPCVIGAMVEGVLVPATNYISDLPSLYSHGNPSQVLYSFIHASFNRECFLLTPYVDLANLFFLLFWLRELTSSISSSLDLLKATFALLRWYPLLALGALQVLEACQIQAIHQIKAERSLYGVKLRET
jgi:hypothetical protein